VSPSPRCGLDQFLDHSRVNEPLYAARDSPLGALAAKSEHLVTRHAYARVIAGILSDGEQHYGLFLAERGGAPFQHLDNELNAHSRCPVSSVVR